MTPSIDGMATERQEVVSHGCEGSAQGNPQEAGASP